jgi:hypothetical protein
LLVLWTARPGRSRRLEVNMAEHVSFDPAGVAAVPAPAEPRARLRLPLSDLLELYGSLGERIDRMDPATLTDENAAYRLYKRLANIIVDLAGQAAS